MNRINKLSKDTEIICSYTVEEAVADGVLADMKIDLSGKYFELGKLIFTERVRCTADESSLFCRFVHDSMLRYMKKDWGEMGKEDIALNDSAVGNKERLFASYDTPKDLGFPKIWIITEWDRSVTTVLFPDEY